MKVGSAGVCAGLSLLGGIRWKSLGTSVGYLLILISSSGSPISNFEGIPLPEHPEQLTRHTTILYTVAAINIISRGTGETTQWHPWNFEQMAAPLQRLQKLHIMIYHCSHLRASPLSGVSDRQ